MKDFRMTLFTRRGIIHFALVLVLIGLVSAPLFAQAVSSRSTTSAGEPSKSEPELIQPEELAKSLQSPKGVPPLILQVGFRVLYLQAHIPNSEYVGPTSEPQGIQRLRQRVQALPRTQYIVIYCGCCPWNKCPNVHPAYNELHALGFRNVKLLYISDNFGKDWVNKGYPVAKGE